MRNFISDSIGQYRGLSRSVYVFFFGRIVTTMGGLIWPLLTLIMSEKMGYSPATIAMISGAVALVFLPAQFIGGKLADHFDRKKIIIIFDSISVFFFFVCAFIEPNHWMLIFFSLAGMFATMEGPAYDSLIADSTKPAEREKVYSLNYLGHNLGFTVGIAIAGMLFHNYLHLAFIFDGITTMISTIMIVTMVKTLHVEDLEDHERNDYEDEAEHSESPWTILKQRKSVLTMVVVFLIVSMVYNQWTFALPLYLAKVFGEAGGPQMYGWLGSFNGIIVIVFTAVLTNALKKTTELSKMIFGVFLYGVSYILILTSNMAWLFFAMMFVFTVGEIVNSIGSSPFVSRRVPSTHRGRINSYIGIAYMFGSFIGQLVSGFIIEYVSFEAAFITMAILAFIATAIMVVNQQVDKKIFPKLYNSDAEAANDAA